MGPRQNRAAASCEGNFVSPDAAHLFEMIRECSGRAVRLPDSGQGRADLHIPQVLPLTEGPICRKLSFLDGN
jgi:hypothetical protein